MLSWQFCFPNVGKETRRSATLDLILANRNEITERVEVVRTLGDTDHVILKFNIMEPQVTEQSQISVLDFKRGDFNKLRIRKKSINGNPKGKNNSRCLGNSKKWDY